MWRLLFRRRGGLDGCDGVGEAVDGRGVERVESWIVFAFGDSGVVGLLDRNFFDFLAAVRGYVCLLYTSRCV